jgi:hypothetical protein
MDSEEADDILNELAADLQANPPRDGNNFNAPITVGQIEQILDEDALQTYITNNTQQSNNILSQLILRFAQDVGDDPERISALANLIKGQTTLLKLLNDQLIKAKDNKTKIEIQKMKQEGNIIKDAIAGNKSVVSSRDAIFKEILKDAQDVEEID